MDLQCSTIVGPKIIMPL